MEVREDERAHNMRDLWNVGWELRVVTREVPMNGNFEDDIVRSWSGPMVLFSVRTVGADRHTSWHTYLPQAFLVGISKLAISGARDLKKKTRKDISYQTARNVI